MDEKAPYAPTPEPPYYAVIFTSLLSGGGTGSIVRPRNG